MPTVAKVSLWGRTVGAVAEDDSGRVYFEYDEDFRNSGLEISPLNLPLSLRGPVEFPELRRSRSFAGLPGVLADSLPDAFGNAVIKRYFEQRGQPQYAMSPVQKLLYVGDRAMGALQFMPALDGRFSKQQHEALEVSKLVEEARMVIEGDTSVAVPEMMQVGASAGGARAKALILWNRKKNLVKSAFANQMSGDESWMIKFDGVTEGTGGPNIREDTRPGPYGRIEYVYSIMARAAGIEMTDTHLLIEREFAHFMTKRFDRDGNERIHLHSLGGMEHVDYNERGIYSYESFFRLLRYLKLGQPVINEAFLRTVFNIAAVNQDDHVKNISFIMNKSGEWSLAPAYDVTYAKGNSWTKTHQMTLGGKDDNFRRKDLEKLANDFDVPQSGAEAIERVTDALKMWEELSSEVHLNNEWISFVRSQFRDITV